jgi:hypothetical protein
MPNRALAALACLLLTAWATIPAACGGSPMASEAGETSVGASAGGASSSPSAEATETPPTPATPDAPASPTLPNGTCAHNASLVSGVCTCHLGEPTVCADTCVDLLTDADHCGDCAHECDPTSTCLAGKCGPAATILVAPTPNRTCGRIDLAVGNGGLAWTDEALGRVEYMSLSTGDSLLLAVGEPSPTRPSVRGTAVFWLDTVRRAIRRGTLDLAAPVDWLASDDELRGYAVSADGTSVYYSILARPGDVLPAGIRELSLGSTVPVPVANFVAGQPGALALLGDKVVATVGVAGYVAAITQVPDDVATCDESVYEALHNCVHVAIGDDIDQELLLLQELLLFGPGPRVIFVEGVSLLASPITTYGKASIAFGSDPISGIATDGQWIYYATTSLALGSAAGVTPRASARPGQVGGAIARGQLAPRSLATDGKRLYWSTADCAIMSLDL